MPLDRKRCRLSSIALAARSRRESIRVSGGRMPFDRRRSVLSFFALVARFRGVSAFRKPMRYPASAAVRALGSMLKYSLASFSYLSSLHCRTSHDVNRRIFGNVNRKLTICDNPILTTPERCLKFEMTKVNHLTLGHEGHEKLRKPSGRPRFLMPLFSPIPLTPGRPEESHLQSPTDPYVSLSTHTARVSHFLEASRLQVDEER